MRHLFIYILIGLLIFQTLQGVWVILHFNWNQETIAATRCENRLQPQLLCSGKCVLTDELTQVLFQESDTNLPSSGEEKPTLLWQALPYVHPSISQLLALTFSLKHLSRVLSFVAKAFPPDVFHPPRIYS